VLDAMSAAAARDDDRWDRMSESIDLLFARMGSLEHNQHLAAGQIDISVQVIEQVLKDQAALTKQIEATGQAVAQLTSHQRDAQRSPFRPDPDYTAPPFNRRPAGDTVNHDHRGGFQGFGENSRHHRHAIPKLAFPKFEGDNPLIWKDKCLNFFQLYELPQSLWTTTAAMNIDGPTAKWLQIYKLRYGLGDWEPFISAVVEQFGSHDYSSAMNELLDFTQTSTLDEYILGFTDLQFHVSMHNPGLDEVFLFHSSSEA